jgi:hypothetical protein
VRAFLFLCFFCLACSAGAQVPEKVIGAPIDTSSLNQKEPTQPAVIVETENAKPVPATNDTIGPRKHSPKTATLLSVFIPGAGQIYNRKNWWWKVPIIYGGGAALVYGAIYYQNNYEAFRDAYQFTQQYPDQAFEDPRFAKYTDDATIRQIRDNYKQARDQCVIGLGLLYALQILDASVEAHLLDFNVNENLSLNVQPQLYLSGPAYAGVQLTFKLK